MDEFDTVDELEVNPIRKRSAFLTVLCILTWIYCAFLLFWAFYAMFNQRDEARHVSFVRQMRPENHIPWYLLQLLPPVFCAIGAGFMWMLNRWGFVIYTIGQLTPIVFSFYTAIALDGIQGASLIFTILANVVPIGFIALYAINLPSMRWKKPA